MAFRRETAAGVSEDMVRPAIGCERPDGGPSGLVAGRGHGLTAAEAASG